VVGFAGALFWMVWALNLAVVQSFVQYIPLHLYAQLFVLVWGFEF
jgi:hypothetical protein